MMTTTALGASPEREKVHEGFRADLLLALLGQTVLFGYSFILSMQVFRPREFLDVPISDSELEVQQALKLEALLSNSIYNIRKSLLKNDELYVALLATHKRALYIFALGTATMLGYMVARVLFTS